MVLHGNIIDKVDMFTFFLGLHIRHATDACHYVWRGEISYARDSAKQARDWYKRALEYAP